MQRSKFDLMVFMVPEFFKGMIKVPDLQRADTAWTLPQKQSLIDSLYNDFDIPKIYFRKKEADHGVWWLIDGQQRLTTIHQFLEGAFPLGTGKTLPKTLKGKHFDELESQDQDRITKRILDCVIIECNDEEEEDMFIRLNNGTPLTVSEKRNAIKGDFRDLAKELAEHPFFQQGKFAFSPKRLAVDVLCAQFACLIVHHMPAASAKALDTIYERHKDFPEKEATKAQVSSLLDWLHQIFPDKRKYLKKSTLISYFILLKHLQENFELQALPPGELLKFFENFERAKKANADLAAGSPDLDRELLDYQIHLNRGAYRPEAIRKRHQILLGRFLSTFPQVQPTSKA